MSEEDKTKSRLSKARAAKVDQDPTPAPGSQAESPQAPVPPPATWQQADAVARGEVVPPPPLPPVVIEFRTLDEITNAISEAEGQKKNFTIGANLSLTAGLCSGIAAFILPQAACSAQLDSAGLHSFDTAFNTFIQTLFLCVAIGVVLGVVAAVLRAQSRKFANRVQELRRQEYAFRSGGRPLNG